MIRIITGPTASGKSGVAEALARASGGSLINADSAQMYGPLVVGTAQPAWADSPIPHHLFGNLETPPSRSVECSGERSADSVSSALYDAARYRREVTALCHELHAQNRPPIIVGGTMFYLKGLFFSLGVDEGVSQIPEAVEAIPVDELWQSLVRVDPVRAQQLHPNDAYRLRRALAKWTVLGIPPSQCAPRYEPWVDERVELICIIPEKNVLAARIRARFEQVFDAWCAEVERLSIEAPAWLAYAQERGCIGYREIAAFVAAGMPAALRAETSASIIRETERYARRQLTFWRSFKEQVLAADPHGGHVTVTEWHYAGTESDPLGARSLDEYVAHMVSMV